MELDLIINLIKNLPDDKLHDDESIKNVFQLVAKETGKSYNEQELNQLLQMFRQLLQEDSQSNMISMLIKGGIGKNQVDTIKEKLDS